MYINLTIYTSHRNISDTTMYIYDHTHFYVPIFIYPSSGSMYNTNFGHVRFAVKSTSGWIMANSRRCKWHASTTLPEHTLHYVLYVFAFRRAYYGMIKF